MYKYSWFFKFIRKRMDPLNPDKAALWKQRLALGYGFIAWNAFGYIIYQYYQGKGDWAKVAGLKTEEEERTPVAAQFATLLGIKNAHVTQISGFTKKGEYDIVEGVVIDHKTEEKETLT